MTAFSSAVNPDRRNDAADTTGCGDRKSEALNQEIGEAGEVFSFPFYFFF